MFVYVLSVSCFCVSCRDHSAQFKRINRSLQYFSTPVWVLVGRPSFLSIVTNATTVAAKGPNRGPSAVPTGAAYNACYLIEQWSGLANVAQPVVAQDAQTVVFPSPRDGDYKYLILILIL